MPGTSLTRNLHTMHNMHESQRSVQGFEARAEECGHVWWQELLCSVRLRQNPHNVHEWHKRVRIFEEQDAPEKVTTPPSPTPQSLYLGEAIW